jgi:cytochrome c peroxidase
VPRRATLAFAALPAALVGVALMAGSLDAKGGAAGAKDAVLGVLALRPLTTVAVPTPANLTTFVKDKAAAAQLGKALFWDMQAGGDGKTACASCHFQAGSDVRATNQLNPGPNHKFDVDGPAATVVAAQFPISPRTDDIVGSHGVFKRQFNSIVPGSAVDDCTSAPDAVFSADGLNLRQATGRNAPSAVNAVFNFHNFWDGRANNVFNGVNPIGPHDPNARVWKRVGGNLVQVPVAISDASLASQAVGPPNNEVEMSCKGRTFPELGRKLLSLQPLGEQHVDSKDSLLGGLAAPDKGLAVTYADLIKRAFQGEWVSTDLLPDGKTTQMEANFSLYWGLAIQAYESGLVSDQTPFDKFAAGDKGALSAQQQDGLKLFQGQGRCVQCHSLPLTTNANSANKFGFAGFFDTGVRPLADDPGALRPDGISAADPRFAGAFKTPTVRNTELNGPYFHDGSAATLREVVDFYNRGGDFHGAANPNVNGQIRPLGLSDAQSKALVAFMLGLTDERVRHEAAPFDHPEILLPNGYAKDAAGRIAASATSSSEAQDVMLSIPATGAAGGASVQPFLGLDPQAH